jgi:hypothetical protein
VTYLLTMKAAIWGTRSSGDAVAAMLRPRATCTVKPWSHGSIYRVTVSWSTQYESYDVSDDSEAVAIPGVDVLSLEDALRYFDARVSGASSAEALQSIELPWHALRERWRRRWQRLDYGICPDCEHQWTDHVGMTDPELDACAECLYEFDHELPTKLTTPCNALAPQPPLP